VSEAFEILAGVTAETFEPHVGANYRVTDETGSSLEVVLIELKRLRTHADQTRVPFSLVFRGPLETVLSQGTYQFEAPDGLVLPIFVVPIGPGRDRLGPQYEAIFN
jgi:hypothetical protein